MTQLTKADLDAAKRAAREGALEAHSQRAAPDEELSQLLAGRAKAAGMSVPQLIAKYTNGGRDSIGFGPGGEVIPAVPDARHKGIGWGGYLSAVANLGTPGCSLEKSDNSKKYLESVGVTKAALAEGSGVTGGYLVPPQFSSTIQQLALEDAIIEPGATKVNMTGLTYQYPTFDYTTNATAGQTSFTSGVIAKWTSEAATRDQSDPTFRQVELKAWELNLYSVASNNLLADNAVGLDGLLTQLFSKAMAWYKEYAFLQGDGVGKPVGIKNCACTISVTRGTSSRIRYVDLLNMQSRLLAESWGSAVWVAHQSAIVDLMLMHDSSGNQTGFGAGRLIFADQMQGATKTPPMQILGRPLYFTEKCNLLGTSGDIYLIDRGRYVIGNRMEIEIAASPHARFTTNQMVWRAILRVDGQPMLNAPITLADGTHTVSPFVKLAT